MTSLPLKDEILRLLSPTEQSLWHGGPTTGEVLSDVSANLAAWQPASDMHSIWGLTLHMAYWKFAVRQRILGLSDQGFERAPDDFPSLPKHLTHEVWTADRNLLRSAESALVELTESLDEDRLQEPLTGGYRVADQLIGVAMHDVHHIGQILLIKRLWNGRSGQ